MSGFRKANKDVGESPAALKMGVYGPAGSGKTFTALLVAEGLAKRTGKRAALVDTELGTKFYTKPVPGRSLHPEAFDVDVMHTRSITEVLSESKALKPDDYSVLVIDSITHLWEACIAAYAGKHTSIGTIPMQAWGKIKRPYKDLMSFLLASPLHVILCGRQGTEYATNEETEELKAIGYKMKAEGETPYEPDVLIRMEAIRAAKTREVSSIIAYAEKDRSGMLAGRSIVNPTFDTLVGPLLPLLGNVATDLPSSEHAAVKDAETLAAQDIERQEYSAALLKTYAAKIALAASGEELKKIGHRITPALKSQMTTADVATLRETYQMRERELTHATAAATT